MISLHWQGPPCRITTSMPPCGPTETQRLRPTIPQERPPQERHCQLGNMSVYPNAFVGSRQSSQEISSEIDAGSSRLKEAVPFCRLCASESGCSQQTQRNQERRGKKDREDFLQKMSYRIIVLLIVK